MTRQRAPVKKSRKIVQLGRAPSEAGIWGSFRAPEELPMTAREARKILRKYGGIEVRQRGSHLIVRLGQLQAVLPVHPGRDLTPGAVHSMRRLWRSLPEKDP